MTSSPVQLHPPAAGSGVIPAPGGFLRPARRVASLFGVAAVVLVTLLVLALAVGPRFLPYRTFTIEGESMSPALPLGSQAVLLRARADQLAVGDIITFRRPGDTNELVTHRIVGVEGRGAKRAFVTKGDANGVADAWRVPAEGVGWRYAFTVPYFGYVVDGLRLPATRFAVLALVALALAGAFLRRIWRPARP